MVLGTKVMPTVPATDLVRAKDFYMGKLELNPVEEDEAGIIFDAGHETQLYLYKRGQASCDHTVATFLVDDVEQEVPRLKQKGIDFEEYDTPDIKTVNNISTSGHYKAAWFRDSEGNILAVTSRI